MTGPADPAGLELEEPPPPDLTASPWTLVDELPEPYVPADVSRETAVLEGDLAGQLEEPAGLFAAASPVPGTFDPGCVVELAGVELADSPWAGDLVAMDGVTVTWGRDSVLQQPDTPTGQLEVFDVTGTWATSADRRGLPVVLRYRGDQYDGTPYFQPFFRGRIGSPITVARKVVQHPETGEELAGHLVTLPLEGDLVDAANRVPTASWPAESMSARVARLQAELAAATSAVSAVAIYSSWLNPGPTVEPVDAADQVSLLDHLVDVFDSAGAGRMTHSPATRIAASLYRKEWPTSTRGTAGLARVLPGTPGDARAGKGAFIRSYAWASSLTTDPSVQHYIDSARLEYDPAEGMSTPARVTRVQLTHPDSANGYKSRTVDKLVAGSDEAATGVRSARLESIVAANNWADSSLAVMESIVRNEGSQWVLQPVRMTTALTAGFESVADAFVLLQGAEADTVSFLQRSWLPAMGLRPLYGVQGGTITYRDQGWELELNLTPVTTSGRQHAVTWEEIDNGTPEYEVQWWDEDHPLGMHESLTLDDLRYCATGLGVTAPAGIGPDTGWDEQQ